MSPRKKDLYEEEKKKSAKNFNLDHVDLQLDFCSTSPTFWVQPATKWWCLANSFYLSQFLSKAKTLKEQEQRSNNNLAKA